MTNKLKQLSNILLWLHLKMRWIKQDGTLTMSDWSVLKSLEGENDNKN